MINTPSKNRLTLKNTRYQCSLRHLKDVYLVGETSSGDISGGLFTENLNVRQK